MATQNKRKKLTSGWVNIQTVMKIKKMMENKEEMAHDYTGELMSEAGYVSLFQGEL